MKPPTITRYAILVLILACGALPGCGRRGATSGTSSGSVVIRVDGSDTMVNLAQAWAERYNKLHPEVSVQVSGGGSGVGIASLIDGVTDLANSSRKMRDKELQRAEANTGQTPQELIVGLDALAVYVHKDNPAENISLDQLARIYGEFPDNEAITQWSQLGVDNKACASGEITRVSRQNNSGTYHYFREAILGDARDYRLGSIDQSGSKDVVDLVSSTPCAIGFSGMGYLIDGVKWLKVSGEPGSPEIAPSVESAKDGSYPIARPLYIYTQGEPQGPVRDYLDWILSSDGQRIVLELGYVPIASTEPPVDGTSDEAAEDEDESAAADNAEAAP